jgi:hypothetical protein
MNRKLNEERRREAAREYQAKYQSIERPMLAKEVYENTLPGKMALAIVAGTEPAGDLFLLIMGIMVAAMRDIRINGVDGTDVDFPIPMNAPYYPKTETIVHRLEKLGHLKLTAETDTGRMYDVIGPDRADRNGQAWANEVLDEISRPEITVVKLGQAKTFTCSEQIQLMISVGIPIGSSFVFELEGFKTTVNLTAAGIVVEPAAFRTLGKEGVAGLIAIWQLSAFAQSRGYRGFSCPVSLSELRQAVG